MSDPVAKGDLAWDEVNKALRARATDYKATYGRNHEDGGTDFVDGIMDAHRTLYTRALRAGQFRPEVPEPPVVGAFQALSEALHPATWVYLGHGDPIAHLIGHMRQRGFEFVRLFDGKPVLGNDPAMHARLEETK